MAKILIIDDEELTLDMLATFLQISGHEPITAIDSRQGWSKLEFEEPEAILLDIQLPDTNGLIMCRQLRDNPDMADVPIIMISAHAPPMIREAEAAGADGYLMKPINLLNLQTTLAKFIA
ncbi:MAG: response regulator [Phototrophicaceae bacterium]|jgi:DNA-binding response OmpR family regulator